MVLNSLKGFSLGGKTHRALKQHIVLLSYIRQGGQNRTTYYIVKQSKIRPVFTQSGLLLCLSSYVGSENVSFLTPNVLAEGQTSGSGGWVKKISPDNNDGQWVVDGHWQSKKNEGFALLLKRR
jgi:hypothetical protein